jgi:hypothetical protein
MITICLLIKQSPLSVLHIQRLISFFVLPSIFHIMPPMTYKKFAETITKHSQLSADIEDANLALEDMEEMFSTALADLAAKHKDQVIQYANRLVTLSIERAKTISQIKATGRSMPRKDAQE